MNPNYYWLLLVLFLTSCYTVPETGRRSLSFVPESQVSALSVQAFEQLKKDSTLSTNAADKARVDQVVRRILKTVGPEANLPPLSNWEWAVFEDDDTVNAFAMPGGKIGVYTGMLKLASSDDELAVVLGHEVAHVAARHGNERLSRQLIISGIGAGVTLATASKDKDLQATILKGLGVGTHLGFMLPFSRKDESEADEIGLLYAARAGYDPRVAIAFWQKMAAASQGKAPPEFLSTHPSNQRRIDQLQALMPRAMEAYQQAQR